MDSFIAVLNRNAGFYSQQRVDIGCCNFVEHEKEIEEGWVSHREGGARIMTPHKLEKCKKKMRC